jgi:hypothetical protein
MGRYLAGNVEFLDNGEISFLRFSPLPGIMHCSMRNLGSTQRRVYIATSFRIK